MLGLSRVVVVNDTITTEETRNFAFYKLVNERIDPSQQSLKAWDGTEYIYFRGKTKFLSIQLDNLTKEDKAFLETLYGYTVQIDIDGTKLLGKLISPLDFKVYKTIGNEYIYSVKLDFVLSVFGNSLVSNVNEISELFAKTDLSNVNDSTILTKLKNVDGVGSGLDADLLQGYAIPNIPIDWGSVQNKPWELLQSFEGTINTQTYYALNTPSDINFFFFIYEITFTDSTSSELGLNVNGVSHVDLHTATDIYITESGTVSGEYSTLWDNFWLFSRRSTASLTSEIRASGFAYVYRNQKIVISSYVVESVENDKFSAGTHWMKGRYSDTVNKFYIYMHSSATITNFKYSWFGIKH